MKKIQVCDLTVYGKKIASIDQETSSNSVRSRNAKYNTNHFKIIVDRDPRDIQGGGRSYREVFKLKTARVSGSAVATKQLKEIRDSIEIEDFKRLLVSLGNDVCGDGGNASNLSLIRCIDVSRIYCEFYLDHYEFIRENFEIEEEEQP